MVRAEAAYRLVLLSSVARWNGSILVTEFPKSGGTWLASMVADLAAVPFPQNQAPTLRPSVFHGHYLRRFGKMSTVVLWRDPRDIVVSWYFHTLVSRHTHPALTDAALRDLQLTDPEDVRCNLPAFIDYMFTRQRAPGFTWNRFFDAWSGEAGHRLHTSYERLSTSATSELARIAWMLGLPDDEARHAAIASDHSFEKMSGRHRGQTDTASFLRKGIVGDWRNSFSREAEAMLGKHTGARLDAYRNFMDALPSVEPATASL